MILHIMALINRSYTLQTCLCKCVSLVMLTIAALCVTSCRSSKKVVADTNEIGDILAGEKIEQHDNTQVWKYGENLTAKVNVKLTVGDKDISTNGQLKMRRDDVILLTLVDPVLGVMEVGRMELDKDSILVVDRVNKRFLRESYGTISSLAGRNVTFSAIQLLFWEKASEAGNSKTISYTIPLKTPVTIDLRLINIGDDGGWSANTKISGKYERVSAAVLFQSMISEE